MTKFEHDEIMVDSWDNVGIQPRYYFDYGGGTDLTENDVAADRINQKRANVITIWG